MTTRILWFARRLAAMSAGEIAARVARESRHTADDLLYRTRRPLWQRTWHPPTATGGAPRRPLGFINPAHAHLVAENDSAGANAIVGAAERFLRGEVAYFGYASIQLENPVDFARDPFTGDRWPDGHGKRLDYRTAAHGDPKWIWELNRLQELPLLVQAWLLTGRDEFADAALQHARRFLTTNEPGRGIAWSNGYEAGLRAISLALTLDALRGSSVLTREDERGLVGALWQHRRWIRRDPSTHSSANNHLIGELVGLVTISLLVPELDEGSSHDVGALALLSREAALQVAGDGTSVEQAFSYALHVIDHLLLVAALLRARGLEVPPEIRSALERAATAIAVQLDADEPPPRYGDSDDARVVRLDGQPLRDPRGVAAALVAYLGHRGARRVADRIDSGALWLFGAEGARRWAETEAADKPLSALLADAGVVVLRSDRRRLLFDAGPLGYLAIAAHGHADSLAVALSDGDEELVVDPGAGSYFGRPELRAAFRGTAMHATVAVDDEDQSVAGGAFLWTRHARSRFLHLDLESNVVAAEHDGYERLTPPVRHRRLVVAQPGQPVIVYDRISKEGDQPISQEWPLHPGLDVVSLESGVAQIARGGVPRLLIAVAATVPGELRAVRGELDPPRGWYSPRLASVVPAWHVCWRTAADGDVDVVALLWPLDEAVWPQPRLTLRRDGGELRLGFESGGVSRELVVDVEALKLR